jgi:hypothetical protein
LATGDLIRLVKDVNRLIYRGPKDAGSVAFAQLDETIRDFKATVAPAGDDMAVKRELAEVMATLDQRILNLLSATLDEQARGNGDLERATDAAAEGIGMFWHEVIHP